MKRTGPTSTQTRALTAQLEKHGKTNKQNAFRVMAEIIQTSTRRRVEVNLTHLEKMHTLYKDKVLVVPGKVLSNGVLSQPIEVAAMKYSKAAKQKILSTKGKAWSLEELITHKIPANKIILVK